MIIPDNILSECVDGIIVNRKDRRKYKTLESKIEAIIHNKPCRVKLIDAIYNKYDGAKNIGSELSYNDIISSINENNCIPQIIYTLHRCCDDEFNKQHFNDLIESVPFQNTINNNWGKSRITDTQESSKASSNIVKENKHMNYYLGYIELRSTYYNFIPQYIYNKKDITELSKDNLEEKFPEYGSVNLGYKKFGDDAHEFLKSLRIDKVDDATDVKPCTSIYAIHFDESELDDNDNDRIRKKLDLQRLIENGEDLKNRIKPISSFGIFKIVTSQETNINDGSFSGMIFVNEKDYPANEYVLLEDGQSLFGPYKLQERSIDGEKYVRPDSGIQMLRTAFDPYISNAMIEAAGVYSSNSESDQYKTISEEMKRIDCVEIDRSSLIDKLVTGVQKFRNYSKNEILNMYICLSQNFLTVFSGEPGTGKTSICNILASSLGLKKFGENNNISKNRYVPVSVERGWSSKRDLIGYFNPLTKKYDRNNAKIYDGLMILNEERQESRFPYIILLDEANLSPIEYYWADFMRAADSNENNVFINIGLEKDIYIPKTLHFLATINNDQTTEELSPRLIDRAWIVRLPKYTEKISGIEVTDDIDKYFKDIVLWSDIENTFVVSESKEMSLKLLADQIYNLFDEHHLTVSPRVQQSIKNYVCVAQEIMEDEVDEVGVCNKKQKALDFAIVQKLLPKINGYYKDYERLFASLKQICDENHLIMTKNALLSMEEFKDQNMGYCKYLI